MVNRKTHFFIRKSHRFLGVILGIQFLIWTVSGLYFSWSNIDEIHGDLQRKHVPPLARDFKLISPEVVLEKSNRVDSLQQIQLVSILNKPFYQINFYSGNVIKKVLANAITGEIRPPISKEESIQIAAESFNGDPKVKMVRYLTSTNGHHEYRQKPLPAWAITFEHSTKTTVYVSAENGKVESFRNNKWRLFDFLWMGHTMDYESRDNINNWLLRVFSGFGLLTVISGFVLFLVSSRTIKSVKKTFRAR